MSRTRAALNTCTLSIIVLFSLHLGETNAFAQGVPGDTQKQAPQESVNPPQQGQDDLQATKDAAREAASATFGKVLPILQKALALSDKRKALPDKGLSIPLVPTTVTDRIKTTKESNEKSINELLDEAIGLLKVSQVTDCRDKIKGLKEAIRSAADRIAKYKQDRISAPAEKDDGIANRLNPFHSTKESIDKQISNEDAMIKESTDKIVALKNDFGKGLRAMGMTVSDEAVDSLLSTVGGDDFIAMCVAFENVRLVTGYLRELTEKSAESPQTARQYYGMYVVLSRTLGRIQDLYVKRIEEEFIPALDSHGKKAQSNIDNAKQLIASNGGNRDSLQSNIDANEWTIKAVDGYTSHLKGTCIF